MKLSRDGRFVLISVNLIAFADDGKRVLVSPGPPLLGYQLQKD